MSQWYVGKNHRTWKLDAFCADKTPTWETHGQTYAYAIGPFRTKRAALWAEQNQWYFSTVSEAETRARLSKED